MATIQQVHNGRTEDRDAECPFSPTGKHSPNWTTVNGKRYRCIPDGTRTSIEVRCNYCSAVGWIGTEADLARSICW